MAERSPLSRSVADSRLLARLGGLLDAVEPMPAEVALAARSAFAWRDLDAQLALLRSDEGVLVRGHGDQRLLTFEAPDLTIVVEVTEIGDGRKLVGQLVPAGPAEVSLEAARSPDDELSAPVDSLGRFALPAIPSGHIRFRCVLTNGRKVVTQWLDN